MNCSSDGSRSTRSYSIDLSASAASTAAHGCEPGRTYSLGRLVDIGTPSIMVAMLLVVDVGNTQTHFGMFRGEELVEHWRFATVRESTADQLGAALRNLMELRGYGFGDLQAS